MKSRTFLIAALGSLLVAAPAAAERRRASRDRDADRDRDVDGRRGLGKVARGERADRAGRDRGERGERGERGDRGRSRVADLEEEDAGDGTEARAVLPIKLKDLIEVAVRLSPELARAKLERTSARGQAGAARKEQSWILSAEASYAINAIGREVEVAPFSTVREDQARAALTLGRKLPTGGSIAVELGMTRTGQEVAIPEEYFDSIGAGQQQSTANGQDPTQEYFTTHQAIAKLSLSQPLARGFGPDVALAAEKRADLQLSETTIKTQLAAEQLIYDVVASYWELAYLGYAVDVRNEAVVLAEQQEKVTREEIRAGASPQSALNAVTYEISSRKEALLTAQLELEKKSLELRRKLGLELSRRQIALRPAEPFEIGADEWDIEEVLAQSRKANRRLVALGVQRKLADLDVNVARNGMLPAVDLSLSGGIVGNGNSQDAAFSGVGAANGYQVMAGLKIEFELSGAARAAHQAAVARRSRTEVERADLARTLDAEVVSAVKAVTAARERVVLADKAIFVAEENVKAEKQNFLAGRADNFRVMERQTQLVESRLRRGRAVADYHTAVAQLQQLGGVLLEQYEVAVRPLDR